MLFSVLAYRPVLSVGLRITINQIECCCAFIILLTSLVGCVRELFVSTELLTTSVVYGSPKTTCIKR